MELIAIAAGALLIGAFVYLNFWFDPTWLSSANGAAEPKGSSAGRSIPRVREIRGFVEGALLFLGICLIAGTLAKVAINTGYGGF